MRSCLPATAALTRAVVLINRFVYGGLNVTPGDDRYPPPEFLREQLPLLSNEDEAWIVAHQNTAVNLIPDMGYGLSCRLTLV